MSENAVFVCEFGDGQTTRMTVSTPLGRLDVERGVRLARCAYYGRWHKQPPAIVKARFEKDGVMLESYSAVDLEDIEERPIEDFDGKALLAEMVRQANEDARRAYLLDEHPDDAAEEPPL